MESSHCSLVFFCILLVTVTTVTAEKNSACETNCKYQEEFCDSYTGQCEPCSSICLPHTNPKFNECGLLCIPFLQVGLEL